MNNIKGYCQFVERQLSFMSLYAPPKIQPPVQGNAIILLTFMEDRTLLSDIFTLTKVTEEASLTRLVVTNRKGDAVKGTWENGRYVWENNIQDLHTWVRGQVKRCYSLSFRYQKRYLRIVLQCVKDQIPFCSTLLPSGCEYVDTMFWANPVKRFLSYMMVGIQVAITPLLFTGTNPIYFLVGSFLLMGGHGFFYRKETHDHFKQCDTAYNTLWGDWLRVTRNAVRENQPSLVTVKDSTDALFKDAIERVSPNYDVLMRTRYRIAQELLDDIIQYDGLPKRKFIEYRARVAGFILDL